ncbi:glycoside hydrolase family 2 TIM barrel-domain containing protein [Conexibacter stalactiti]|uniref:Glycoside hydrolase family 2 TIM barrel-domain containing protein n=1 Tax=Conexibacter stalactiti TaxID=1940611 RepID=A0ABU4HNS3_9ACTN|nr:glycoside hydrolase family 2 TIM barrel-domain containing protein [Conexibacter stalactiti]MDW5594963.1 glycoside hydrolase family 2 TIM barrel-domain containing protein [Conexibacter stalactiti]MEC5035605.1 glycoside hydrolase family 2 TIM barrel-domain containing protein [Conexibacter stalactiti]
MPRRPSFPAFAIALALCGAALAPTVASAEEETGAAPAPPTSPAAPTTPMTAPSSEVTVPAGAPLYLEGQDDRILVDGPWLFRADLEDAGVPQRFYSQSGVDGWSGTTAPMVWNVGGSTRESYEGSIGWYRKDFRLPASRTARTDRWIVRFEAVNFRATIWLNGRKLGEHIGGYTPFELELPNLNAKGVNRLVIRADNRRAIPEGIVSQPIPATGWWNYGGLQREVYLRKVDRLDLTDVQVSPSLPKVGGSATVTANATVTNYTRGNQLVTLRGRFGTQPLDFGEQVVAAGKSVTLTTRTIVRNPRLWSPARPSLYRVRLVAGAQGANERRATEVAGYTLETGIRSLVVSGSGQLALNGQTVRFRGVAIHEDTLARGSAMNNADRASLMRLVRDSGSTLVRAHYPLHPSFQQLADRQGMLLWSEIPSTYQLSEADLGRAEFRKLALQEVREDLLANRNHPSIAVWSVGNEMASSPGRNQASYLRTSADLIRTLHPTALVGLAFAGHPESGCQASYAPIDVLGMNDYFGWYTGVGGNIADRDELDPFLDQLRACYPKQAIAVTEYGAEANRDGPVEEKGTYEFQREFVAYHLAAFASKPWLSGSVYWALQEFRIRNAWGGGNPWPTPPIHQKGLVRLDFTRKPAYDVLRTSYRASRQYVPRGSARR